MKLDASSPQIAHFLPLVQIPNESSKQVNLLTETLQKKESIFPPATQIKPFLQRQYKDLKNELSQFREKQIIQIKLPQYPLSQMRNGFLSLSPQAKIGIASLFSSLGALFAGIAATQFFSTEGNQESASEPKNNDPTPEQKNEEPIPETEKTRETADQKTENSFSEPNIPSNSQSKEEEDSSPEPKTEVRSSKNKIYPFCLPEEKNVHFINGTTPPKPQLDPLKFLPEYKDFTNLLRQNLTNPDSVNTSRPLVKITNQFSPSFQCPKGELPVFTNSSAEFIVPSLARTDICELFSQIGKNNLQPTPLMAPSNNTVVLTHHPLLSERNIWTALFGVSLITAAAVGLISKYCLNKGTSKKPAEESSSLHAKASTPRDNHPIFPIGGDRRPLYRRRSEPIVKNLGMEKVFEKLKSSPIELLTFRLKNDGLYKNEISALEIINRLEEYPEFTSSTIEITPNHPFVFPIPPRGTEFNIILAQTLMLVRLDDQVTIYSYEDNFTPKQRRQIRKDFVENLFVIAPPNTRWKINIGENGAMTSSLLEQERGISNSLIETPSPKDYLEFIKKCSSYVWLTIGFEEKIKCVDSGKLIEFIEQIQESTKPENIHVLNKWDELEIIRPNTGASFNTNVIYSEEHDVLLVYYNEGDAPETNSDSDKEDSAPFVSQLEIIDFREASTREKASLLKFIKAFCEGSNTNQFKSAEQTKKGKEISKDSSSDEGSDSVSKEKRNVVSSDNEDSSADGEKLN